MFTGIIESMAKVLQNQSGRLVLERPAEFEDIKTGSSICVSGVCLTVVEFDSTQMQFDAIPETLAKTTLGKLGPGDQVNLERALAANGRYEGHVVQGHVEGVGKITERIDQAEDVRLTVMVPAELATYIVPKGSITLDGVSLTVADRQNGECTVALIPHTLEHTTLGARQPGDLLNIETDILGRYAYYLSQPQS